MSVQYLTFYSEPFTTALSGPEQRKNLETQSWFHGCISRNQAEHFVKNVSNRDYYDVAIVGVS